MVSNLELKKKKRVLVAMSGGVDSSVVAALLVEQGYEVIGATMQVWDYSENACDIEEGNGTCCSSTDVDDARAVCDRLDIPFYVLNCESQFQAYVIDPFIGAYLEGKTPIPCVNCNTYLKFDHLIRKMNELDCDYLATGHYAQIVNDDKGQAQVVTSSDSWKDQTYFLFSIDKSIIPKLMFPVGHLNKDQVREEAIRFGLSVAKKKDSTGICFIGKAGYGKFIEDHVAPDLLKPGRLRLYPNGEDLGGHPGIHQFTYGQRKGLGIATGQPVYVIKTDAATADVWLGEEKYLYSNDLTLRDLNWLDEVSEGEDLNVKVRFHHKGAPGKLHKNSEGQWTLHFTEPQRAITPGQAAVFYREKQLVGGGWIV